MMSKLVMISLYLICSLFCWFVFGQQQQQQQINSQNSALHNGDNKVDTVVSQSEKSGFNLGGWFDFSGSPRKPNEIQQPNMQKVFNFEGFMKKFGKVYPNTIERMIRMKLYLARAFNAFISMVNFTHKKKSYYLAVNQMSDWTQDEVKQLFKYKSNPHLADDEVIEVDEAKLRQLKENLNFYTHKNKQHRLAKREVDHENNNNNEQKTTGNELQRHKRNVYFNKAKKAGETIIDKISHWDSLNTKPDSIQVSDEIRLDHRKSGCIAPVKDQKKCGSCYIFATVAMFEWLQCRLNGTLLEFSEQYIIDCGDRIGMKGCEDGREFEVGEFVHKFGLELLNDYEYLARKDECPYNRKLNARKMGKIRLKEPRIQGMRKDFLEKVLEVTPLVVGVATGIQFTQYGGAVDDGKHCNPDYGHSMLLIGDGRQNGRDYWLFRNSHGESFGEGGYYKLDKASNCFIDDGMSFIPKAIFDLENFDAFENRYYDQRPLMERRRRIDDILKRLHLSRQRKQV